MRLLLAAYCILVALSSASAKPNPNPRPRSPPLDRASVVAVPKKSPQRAKAEDGAWRVRTATQLSILGYQGRSTTKGAAPKQQLDRAAVIKVAKKSPQRSKPAVRKATRLAVTGYQGESTTKDAKR
ncbi:hypothetical protein EMIHUDRAFT_366867 [Emiliania huxleyi CCMP1516]|uniref:Secreted protein n=2 Tax=Emiliania huxleyi TaxID=2903 RepID=A0A0D3JTN2_EMIH1|nr:hypothetical protein EMIHUDRAFT_366867 [Emiliania huxleyi CCMP1516]EOD26867.1 hypothetical protein EMIHUDRAFT_366867 [Emiliania huxleyi CCMP1516]|eukprot:XP_005779296.1 hypothetical protein EMIHUDRAFT_366867 [Emiliania huxleyi CCMP1516]